MAKSNKASASTWRRRDADYRRTMKERRDANAARRKSVVGIDPETDAEQSR